MLYPRVSHSEASPKAISRRTSYLRVRLEFHRYPHVIPALFNGYKFGPPRDFTLASTCSWIGHPVSGLQHATTALLRLAFATAPVLQHLNLATYRNSLARSTKSTWSLALPLLVSIRFQVLFHSPPGVLFTFPSRYWFAIGHRVVFSLSGWSPMIPAGFHVPRRTQVPPRSMSSLRIRVSHPLRIPFPWDSPDSSCHLYRRSYNPGLCPVWAPPLSLAATYGIDFSFSSCRYLDVSVPCVLPRHDGRHAVSAS